MRVLSSEPSAAERALLLVIALRSGVLDLAPFIQGRRLWKFRGKKPQGRPTKHQIVHITRTCDGKWAPILSSASLAADCPLP